MAIRGQDDGPLFRLRDGRPLTCIMLVQRLREILTLAGINCSRYSGHSFCISAATAAIASYATVQTLDRWASDSFKHYVRIPRQELALISQQLVENLDNQLVASLTIQLLSVLLLSPPSDSLYYSTMIITIKIIMTLITNEYTSYKRNCLGG